MKRRPSSKKLERSLKSIVREMQSSSHELAGILLDRCQSIETLMKLHINRNDPTKDLADLDERTFGRLLGMFKKHSSDQELNDWLETLRQLRNDVAHKFFRDTQIWTKELGPGVERLNHSVLRKGLRITEICFNGLKKLDNAPRRN